MLPRSPFHLASVLSLVVACSGTAPSGALFGPEPERPATATDQAAPEPTPDPGPAPSAPDATAPTPARDAGVDAPRPPPACLATKKVCGNTCVLIDDPAFGCTPTSCQPCPSSPVGTPTCDRGKCALTCPTGQSYCQGTCIVDSVASCGASCKACDAPAHTVPACVAGACKAPCVAGWLDCDGRRTNGCEVDGQSDPDHCGSCTNQCGFNEECWAGTCFNRGG